MELLIFWYLLIVSALFASTATNIVVESQVKSVECKTFYDLLQYKNLFCMFWQEKVPPNTPRLTSQLQRRPTKSARSMLWVGRRACTLWNWEERGRHIDFFITELSQQDVSAQEQRTTSNCKVCKKHGSEGFFKSRLFPKDPLRFTVGFILCPVPSFEYRFSFFGSFFICPSVHFFSDLELLLQS